MRFLSLALAATLLGTSAAADWTHRQGNGRASAIYDAGRYTVMITCSRGSGLEFSILDDELRGNEYEGVDSLMVWVTLPDGRTDRWPITPVWQEDGALSGDLIVSDFNLEFFRNGTRFEVDSPQTRKVFAKGNMKGSGAARLAILEQCGI